MFGKEDLIQTTLFSFHSTHMGFRSADTNFFMTLLLILTFNQVSQSHDLEYYLYTGSPKTVPALTSLILASRWDSYHRFLKLSKSKTKLCFLPNFLPSVKGNSHPPRPQILESLLTLLSPTPHIQAVEKFS